VGAFAFVLRLLAGVTIVRLWIVRKKFVQMQNFRLSCQILVSRNAGFLQRLYRTAMVLCICIMYYVFVKIGNNNTL
jgi:hypothetical protein